MSKRDHMTPPLPADPELRWEPEAFERVTDDELAQLAAPNVLESAAYFELWRRYHPLVAALVHQRVHGQDAEHLVTTFFCHKLPRVLHQFTPRSASGSSFESWLRRVVTNYLHDEWRRRKTRRSREVQHGVDLSEVADRNRDYATPPRAEEAAEQNHLVYFLREIMNEMLEPVDRYIFQARYWDEKPMTLIARELDLTEANVRIRHWRAKKRLQRVCAIYRKAGLL